MCGSQPHTGSAAAPAPPADPAVLPTSPLFDAHCHPADNMPSAALIPSMRAAQLVVVATRAQDQHLVAQLADEHGARVVPGFGWHPWFSHQLYDDTAARVGLEKDEEKKEEEEEEGGDAKVTHYARVLDIKTPLSPHDRRFIHGLPEPRLLSRVLAEAEARLRQYPHAIVGEIGLDRAFRLPEHPSSSSPSLPTDSPCPTDSSCPVSPPTPLSPTPGTRAGRRLSPYRVSTAHQTAVLTAYLRLAAAHRRPVSVHGVQAHGLLFDALSALWRGHEVPVANRRRRRAMARGGEVYGFESESESESESDSDSGPDSSASIAAPFPPKVCLHSFSATSDVARRYTHASVPCKVFFSFSAAVNLAGTSADAQARAAARGKQPSAAAQKLAAVLAAVPDDRILAESDLDAAGPRMDAELERIYVVICEVKGWTLEEGVQRIKRNYDDFIRVEGGQ